MKKIPLLLAVITLMWSCKQSATKKAAVTNEADSQSTKKEVASKPSNIAAPQIVLLQKSLNGIDSTDVKRMEDDFSDHIFEQKLPNTKRSIWFRREILDQMVDLLKKERGSKTSGEKGAPDGFRIYFISKTTNQSDLSIAIVSTYNNGKDTSYPGLFLHKDYYYHDSSHPLFKTLTNINGEECVGNCGGGALLYTPCVGSDCSDGNCNTIPDHDIARAYGERMINLFGNNTINTKSVWFSFEFLVALDAITLPTPSNPSKSEPIDGVRIYYGNYGQTEIDQAGRTSTVTSEKSDRDTFVLTPTIAGTKPNTHVDIFKCEALEKAWANIHRKTDAYNNGELCPNHCDK